MEMDGRCWMLMFVAIQSGVVKREGKLAVRAAKERAMEVNQPPVPIRNDSPCQSKYGGIELLADARGHWPHIRGARLPGQIRRGGCN